MGLMQWQLVRATSCFYVFWKLALLLLCHWPKNSRLFSISDMAMNINKLREKKICNTWLSSFFTKFFSWSRGGDSNLGDTSLSCPEIWPHGRVVPFITLDKKLLKKQSKDELSVSNTNFRSWSSAWYGCNKWLYLCSCKNKSNPPTTIGLRIKWKEINTKSKTRYSYFYFCF